MPQYTKNNPRAFTLIEVMVVIAIISILTGVVIASLGKGRVQRELETNAREFASVVREAQNYALTGKQIAGNTACAFYVRWSASAYALEYTYKNGSENCTATPTPIATRTHTLKYGVTFANQGIVAFALPWANTSAQQVNFQKLTSRHSVCVSDAGKISDQAGTICP
ncbi:MAG: prepilin-type N-terminal cleavage/methylation domain-containing protein [Candidatus Moraniibacteriota bacterium]